MKNDSLLREVDMLREYNALAVSKADEHELISSERGVAIGRLEYAVSELKDNLNRLYDQNTELHKIVNRNSERISADKTYLDAFREKIYRGEG